jgi:hypothetical protein
MLKQFLVALVAHKARNRLNHQESVPLTTNLDGCWMEGATAPMFALAHLRLLTL